MRKYKLIISALLITLVATSVYTGTTSAATGYQGYAIYRDGVFFGADWHAGMMDSAYSDYYLPVTHHSGSGVVKWDSWANFLDGNNFKGVYKPSGSIVENYRDLFVGKARALKDAQIGYTVWHMLNWDDADTSLGDWIDVDEITLIRCDGVIEYSYEWYGFRVYGNNDYWDITKAEMDNKEMHSVFTVTPKIQKDYLVLVTSSVPKSP
ncbi:hypothetical protein J4772_31675 [Cohnella sp. LGH]|uniref:hypothetical protein n=1 Tax=Cohnella sp. LGH TaxID=1619153 RepID=UPI001ADC79BD|nr:hypothetical protein [Cohnella sp. LGH]QTH42022.1 hypothetical protein J4772_31675 [Cohnella sp. LGH]